MLANVSALLFEQVPQYFSIDRVIRFLQIDKKVVLSLSLSMNFVEEAAGVNGS
jgi:hypothetical protein